LIKTYKFRLYPNGKQNEHMWNHVHACRFIYNWALEEKIKSYEIKKEKLTCFDLNNKLVNLKKSKPWLKEINAQTLQGCVRILDNDFTKFFRKKGEFPKFKTKKGFSKSFPIPQNYKISYEEKKVFLPKIGNVKAIFDRKIEGDLKSSVVFITKTNKWFIGIFVDDGKQIPDTKKPSEESLIGIDVGIRTFATLSNGEKIENPRFLTNNKKRLKVLEKRMKRKKEGSHNREKSYHKYVKLHEKIKNQRNDFLNKVSTKIVSENQAIAVETLDIIGMCTSKKIEDLLTDVSWGKFFRMLEYKCLWNEKPFIKIGRFKPSSKICNNCGSINHKLKLSDVEWICEHCGCFHDRDVNAAINIKKFAIQEQNLVGLRSGLERSGELEDLFEKKRMNQEIHEG